MSAYVTVNRLTLVQLHREECKQRAHLKKIAEMQCHSGLDNPRRICTIVNDRIQLPYA